MKNWMLHSCVWIFPWLCYFSQSLIYRWWMERQITEREREKKVETNINGNGIATMEAHPHINGKKPSAIAIKIDVFVVWFMTRTLSVNAHCILVWFETKTFVLNATSGVSLYSFDSICSFVCLFIWNATILFALLAAIS